MYVWSPGVVQTSNLAAVTLTSYFSLHIISLHNTIAGGYCSLSAVQVKWPPSKITLTVILEILRITGHHFPVFLQVIVSCTPNLLWKHSEMFIYLFLKFGGLLLFNKILVFWKTIFVFVERLARGYKNIIIIIFIITITHCCALVYFLNMWSHFIGVSNFWIEHWLISLRYPEDLSSK